MCMAPKVSGWREGNVVETIMALAPLYGVDTETALRIGACESGLQADATNSTSGAAGTFQWLAGSWAYIGSPGDRYNAEDNIRAFLTYYGQNKSWWECK